MDAFWSVYAEKPTLVGFGLVAISILEGGTNHISTFNRIHMLEASLMIKFPLQITVFSGIATTQGRKNGDRAPGDYNFDPLNFGKNPAAVKDLQLKEVIDTV